MFNHLFHMFKGTSPQLLAVFLGTLNAVTDGMQFGWSSPTIPKLEEPDSPILITPGDGVLLETIWMFGGIAGLPLSIYLVNSLGRKNSVILSSCFSTCGWLCIAAGTNVYHLFIGRFILGITSDIAFNACPIYIAEIAHQKVRGFLAGMIYLMMLLGILIIYVIGPIISIRAAGITGICILLVQIVFFPFMPESPYFYIYKDKYDKAKNSLERLRVDEDVTRELMEIKKAVDRQKSERGRPQDLFLIESNRKACIIITLLNSSQHFAGITILIMNLHDILDQAGSTVLSSSAAGICFAFLMLVAATTASIVVDRYGRRLLLIFSGISTSIVLFTIAIYFHLQLLSVDLTTVSWIPTLAVLFYAFTFKLGLGIVPIVTTGELFPAPVKNWGMALSDTVYVLASTTSIYLYQWLSDSYGIYMSFYVFAICCLVSTILLGIITPETKGKTLEEIQMSLKK